MHYIRTAFLTNYCENHYIEFALANTSNRGSDIYRAARHIDGALRLTPFSERRERKGSLIADA